MYCTGRTGEKGEHGDQGHLGPKGEKGTQVKIKSIQLKGQSSNENIFVKISISKNLFEKVRKGFSKLL